MPSNYTLINEYALICDEKIYIESNYVKHLNNELYSKNNIYILEIANINTNMLLKCNENYNIVLKNKIYDLDSKIYYTNIIAKCIEYSNNKMKFQILNFK